MAATGQLRQRKKDRTLAEISSVAMRLFAERGFDAVTVEEISAAAEVSHRTFYRYFQSKEDLVLGDPDRNLADMREAFAQRPSSETVLESIRAVIIELAGNFERDISDDRLRCQLVLATPSLQHRRQEHLFEFEAALLPLIAERLAVDPSADMRPALIAACASAAVRVSTSTWMVHRTEHALLPTVDEAFAILTTGLA